MITLNHQTPSGGKKTKIPFLRKNIIISSLLATVISTSALGQANNTVSEKYGRDIDMRLKSTPQVSLLVPKTSQLQEVEAAKNIRPEIIAEFNEYGVTSSLINATGNLTAEAIDGKSLKSTAINFVNNSIDLLGLTSSDIQNMEVTDEVKSISGVTHFYFRQTHNGIPVYNGQLQIHVTQNGAISLVNNAFVPQLANSITSKLPQIDAQQAIMKAVDFLKIKLSHSPKVVQKSNDLSSTTKVIQSELSSEVIEAKLVWMPIAPGNVVPAWNFQFMMDHSWPNVTVNAVSGELVTSFDMMRDAQYQVYQEPVESPIHTTPAPPADARTLVVNPEDATASRNGWFNSGSTLMEGNNVHACADRNGNNSCDTPEPTCSGLVCDFGVDLTTDPSNSQAASIANLFYWNNLIHDIQYQYGFDEQGGNFQENNFGLGGAGSDSVNAETQDNANGSSDCNANFATSPDGSNPRMQMFTCSRGNPERDGSFDNGVIVHEYGHGISIRQVGGPSTTTCLNNRQQAGEGWSDWHGLVYTAKPSHVGTTTRGLGAYLFALGPDGTIRPQQYSTDPTVNSYTYASINGLAVPHGVGSVWAQAAWEVYWALVDKHGFEGDLVNFDINDASEAGNKRALFYINEGLKNTACSPTFVSNRDGIIAAATNSFGGEDVCTIWEAFAQFGLGVNAVSGGSGSTSPTNGFNLPASCTAPPTDCTVAESFESGNGGWSNSSASTCSTGSFVSATPTSVVNGGVTTQVGGASDGSNALFTATNTSAGVNDVDNGNCIVTSPSTSVANTSNLSISYFHGQRDAGDDANGDFFNLEYSTDAGATFQSLASNGDSTSNASWQQATAAIPAGSDVVIRVQCSDGTTAGDLVECGVDDVKICDVP